VFALACRLVDLDRSSYRYEASGSQRRTARRVGEAGATEATLRIPAFACSAEQAWTLRRVRSGFSLKNSHLGEEDWGFIINKRMAVRAHRESFEECHSARTQRLRRGNHTKAWNCPYDTETNGKFSLRVFASLAARKHDRKQKSDDSSNQCSRNGHAV
jgi:hypothetical protein